MMLLRKRNAAFTFELKPGERILLLKLLRQYPLTPLSHHKIAHGAVTGKRAGEQQLLEEAMAAHQQALRQQVQDLLAPGRRFTKFGDQYHLTLREAEIEWLLQVLNDVRVGCWVQLGCPEHEQLNELRQTNADANLLMEMAVLFQMVLLSALHPDDESPLDDESDVP